MSSEDNPNGQPVRADHRRKGEHMQVRVDREKCQGHGNCTMSAPRIFKISDDDGLAFVTTEQVEEADRDAVELAVTGCPERAIEV